MPLRTRLGPLLVAALIAAASGACGSSAADSAAGVLATQHQLSPSPVESGLEAGSQETTSPPPTQLPVPLASDVPSRVVVPELRIDLPIVSGALVLPGNSPDYPLCDVAQYLTTYPYPGRLGSTTWIYAHAREGMFLRLLEASRRNDGEELLGQTVDVFSTGNVRYRYRVSQVLRHTTDRSAASDVRRDQGRLILQTSEGPRGVVPKLQVVAELISSTSVSAADAQPKASPMVCAIR
ncbi:MAG: hypothetical protein ABIZ52_06810 [Candidatus Limnocylindrales bacterium]